eukprot:tig00021357_g20791.t1
MQYDVDARRQLADKCSLKRVPETGSGARDRESPKRTARTIHLARARGLDDLPSKEGGKIEFELKNEFHLSDFQIQEAVRIRDRLAIICDFIDEKTGWEPRLRGDILNRPRSDYEGEKFFAALQRGELELPPCGAQREDHRDRVRTFLEQHGGYDCPPVVPRCIANTCTKSASVPPDDSTTSTELPRALPSSSSAAPGSGVSLLHDRDHDPNSNASVINIATPTNANSKRIKKESASDSEEKESNQSESEEDDEERTDNGDEAAATKTRWRELHKSGQMIVEDVFKLDGGYYAAFFLESEKVVSPPLASVDEALRFVDRCRVAWFGPDGENRYGMKIHFPIEGVARGHKLAPNDDAGGRAAARPRLAGASPAAASHRVAVDASSLPGTRAPRRELPAAPASSTCTSSTSSTARSPIRRKNLLPRPPSSALGLRGPAGARRAAALLVGRGGGAAGGGVAHWTGPAGARRAAARLIRRGPTGRGGRRRGSSGGAEARRAAARLAGRGPAGRGGRRRFSSGGAEARRAAALLTGRARRVRGGRRRG